MGQRKGYIQSFEHKERRSKSLQKGAYFQCLKCQSQFWRKPSAIKKGDNKFCSKQCYLSWLKGRERSDEFKAKCRSARRKNIHQYEKSKLNRFWRMSTEYKEWRSLVYSRDNWTCQECNARSSAGNYVRLEAHHIKPFCTYVELRFDINNGITLCKKCHDKKPKGKQIYNVG